MSRDGYLAWLVDKYLRCPFCGYPSMSVKGFLYHIAWQCYDALQYSKGVN
jgi:hypothetical protein